MKESIIRTIRNQFELETITTKKELINTKDFILSKQLIRLAISKSENIRDVNYVQDTKYFSYNLSFSLKNSATIGLNSLNIQGICFKTILKNF